MWSKSKLTVLLGAMSTSTLMQASIKDVIVQFLMVDLPGIQVTPQPLLSLAGFVYFGCLGILNYTRCMSLVGNLLVSVSYFVIQAYTLHRLLHVPCTKAVPRMIFIGCVNSLVVIFLHEIFMRFHPDLQDAAVLWHFGLWSFAATTITFVVQVMIAYAIFARFDSKLNKRKLGIALIIATLLSTIFLIMVYVVTNWDRILRQFVH